MKKNRYSLIVIVATLLIIMSCAKSIPLGYGDDPPLVLMISWMSDGPWQLVSATRYDSTKIISRYKGTVMDTLIFGYGEDANQNIVQTDANMYINGVYTVCPYKYHNPLDSTIILGPSCRAGYNDTLRFNSFSEYSVVYRVKFDSANIHCWELDSLKKIHLTP